MKHSPKGMSGIDPITAILRLERPLRLTLAGMWVERLARAFWPLWSIALATVAVLAFGVQDHLAVEVFWCLALAVLVGSAWAAWRGRGLFNAPTRTEALARLDSRLPGNPIAALQDTQAIGATDPASQAVWAAHRARMAARAAGAKVVEPDLRLSSRDPYALRYVALSALVLALMFGSLWRVTSVAGMGPGGDALAASGPAWEGWAQPPAYTGKPTLYLNDLTAQTLSLPVGTRIQLRLYGEVGDLVLAETVSGRIEVPPASDAVQDFVVTTSGSVAIDGPNGRKWQITATPDMTPTVTPTGDIGREADGRFKQSFSAKDDYGITAGQVTIAIDTAALVRRFGLAADPEPVEAVVLDLPSPITGDRADYTEILIDDLSKHVFANLPVAMTFAVTDAAGQTGTAEPLSVTLPGRRFFDPLAAALVEMRRDILWTRGNAPRTVQVLKAVTNLPEDLIRNERAYLRLRVVMRQLEAEQATLTIEARDGLAEELWQIALLVEEGDLASAMERLQRAQDRLAEAIQNGASPEEIDELMQEMRDALDNYMRQLAEEAERNPDSQMSQEQGGMTMSQDQLQQMLDELQKLMEEGRTAEAQELMEQLRQFMENMQMAQGQPGQGQGQGGPGQQAMRDLNQTLRDQQGLSDDAFRDLQDGTEGNEGQERGDQPDDKSLAERQQELQDRLGELNGGQLPGEGTDNGEAGRQQLDRAGRAMEEAERALREGDLPGALDRQAEAMEAMRDGIQQFGEAMAEEQRQPGGDQQGRLDGTADPNSQRDPLGREPGDSARIGSDRNMLQGEDVYRRAQDLLDEIRRRSGEQVRPEGERDYLKRLLDLF